MSEERDYASDTDESDEDFRPDKITGVESPLSEEEETDDDNEAPEENDNNVCQLGRKSKRTTKIVIKKKRSNIKNKQAVSDDDEDIDTNTLKRCTRQTDNVMSNGKEKSLEKDELVSDEEDKTRTNTLWADFLKDVNPKASSSKAKNAARLDENVNNSPDNIFPVGNGNTLTQDVNRLTSVKSKEEETKKITVTEVLDFAGEEMCIEREVDASSIKENKAAATQPVKKQPFGRMLPGVGMKRTIPTATSSASCGIGSIINQIGKKKKLSVLEKSQMDWNNFKQTEGIDEQLQTFNKGKDGYLERQDFLQRTDLRQFEIEKNLRQSSRRPL